MGFFSSIGSFIKKNVNIHTAVNLVGQAASVIPGVGSVVGGTILGIQAAHDAQVAQNDADQQALDAANQQAADAGKIVGNAAGAVTGTFVGSAVQSASPYVKAGLAKAGADTANLSIKQWFKDHWKVVVGVGIGVIGLIVVAVRMFGKKSHHRASYRR